MEKGKKVFVAELLKILKDASSIEMEYVFSMEHWGQLLGISKKEFKAWESGKKAPKVETLAAIRDILSGASRITDLYHQFQALCAVDLDDFDDFDLLIKNYRAANIYNALAEIQLKKLVELATFARVASPEKEAFYIQLGALAYWTGFLDKKTRDELFKKFNIEAEMLVFEKNV